MSAEDTRPKPYIPAGAVGRAELREALRILGDLQRGRGELNAARTALEIELLRKGDDRLRAGRRGSGGAGHLRFEIEQRHGVHDP